MKLALREVSEKEKQKIERLENLSLDDLYIEFGQQIGSLGLAGDVKEQVTRYLEQKRQELYDVVCVEGNYCVFIKENRGAKFIDIAAALADLLAPCFAAIPVNTLAVLTMRTIIGDLCDCER
jgi:hypothetical protein